MRLKFKAIGKGVNGGIQIRSRRIPNHHEMIGYQADIADGYWGALYDELRRVPRFSPVPRPSWSRRS